MILSLRWLIRISNIVYYDSVCSWQSGEALSMRRRKGNKKGSVVGMIAMSKTAPKVHHSVSLGYGASSLT